MNEDIEWLKDEVYKLYPSHVEMYEFPDDLVVLETKMVNYFISLIEQLDDSKADAVVYNIAGFLTELEYNPGVCDEKTVILEIHKQLEEYYNVPKEVITE